MSDYEGLTFEEAVIKAYDKYLREEIAPFDPKDQYFYETVPAMHIMEHGPHEWPRDFRLYVGKNIIPLHKK